jgi:hypothetical protein
MLAEFGRKGTDFGDVRGKTNGSHPLKGTSQEKKLFLP